MQVRKLHSVRKTLTCRTSFPPHVEYKFNVPIPESIYIEDRDYLGLVYKIDDKFYHPWIFNVYKPRYDAIPKCCLSEYSGLIDDKIGRFWNSYFTTSPTCENWFVNRIIHGLPSLKYDTEYARTFIAKDYGNLSTVMFYKDYEKNVEMFADCFQIKPGTQDYDLIIRRYNLD